MSDDNDSEIQPNIDRNINNHSLMINNDDKCDQIDDDKCDQIDKKVIKTNIEILALLVND